MPDPLFILAPARSFTTIVGTMLGQHPQMYGVPELNLFVAESMREREEILARRWPAPSGLLRTVAHLWVGEQTFQTCALARRWVAARMGSACVSVMRELIERVGDRILVEKSPDSARRIEFLQRARRGFSRARFIHLLRHPRSQCRSIMEFGGRGAGSLVQIVAQLGLPVPAAVQLGMYDWSTDPPTIDLQKYWYSFHVNISTFLDTLPRDRWIRLRGEDVLADPDKHLAEIAAWLDLRGDAEAIEMMKQPERSPFAGFGPVNAPGGGDGKFFADPTLRPYKPDPTLSLDGPLPWRRDERGFSPEVRLLATEFGYS